MGACVLTTAEADSQWPPTAPGTAATGGFQPVLENTLGTVVAERDIRLPMVELTLSA